MKHTHRLKQSPDIRRLSQTVPMVRYCPPFQDNLRMNEFRKIRICASLIRVKIAISVIVPLKNVTCRQFHGDDVECSAGFAYESEKIGHVISGVEQGMMAAYGQSMGLHQRRSLGPACSPCLVF